MQYVLCCLLTILDNILSSNTDKVCHGRGSCIGPNTCFCFSHASGPDCEKCDEGYYGDKCDNAYDSNKPELIAGVTIGTMFAISCVLLAIVVPFTIFYYRKQHKARLQQLELRNLLQEHLVDDVEMSEAQEWIIHRDDLTFEERISEGA